MGEIVGLFNRTNPKTSIFDATPFKEPFERTGNPRNPKAYKFNGCSAPKQQPRETLPPFLLSLSPVLADLTKDQGGRAAGLPGSLFPKRAIHRCR